MSSVNPRRVSDVVVVVPTETIAIPDTSSSSSWPSLKNDYELREVISVHETGVVHAAFCLPRQQACEIKIIHLPQAGSSESDMEKLKDEGDYMFKKHGDLFVQSFLAGGGHDGIWFILKVGSSTQLHNTLLVDDDDDDKVDHDDKNKSDDNDANNNNNNNNNSKWLGNNNESSSSSSSSCSSSSSFSVNTTTPTTTGTTDNDTSYYNESSTGVVDDEEESSGSSVNVEVQRLHVRFRSTLIIHEIEPRGAEEGTAAEQQQQHVDDDDNNNNTTTTCTYDLRSRPVRVDYKILSATGKKVVKK